jgi:hypothetical protein
MKFFFKRLEKISSLFSKPSEKQNYFEPELSKLINTHYDQAMSSLHAFKQQNDDVALRLHALRFILWTLPSSNQHTFINRETNPYSIFSLPSTFIPVKYLKGSLTKDAGQPELLVCP